MNCLTKCGWTARILLSMAVFALGAAAQPLSAQERYELTGTVRDAVTREALIGVVVQAGDQNYAATNNKGEYTIRASAGDILKITHIGYKTTEIPVNGRTGIDIDLEEDLTGIDEVVVIGYGTTTKKEVTGSVASVRAEDLNNGSYTTAAGMLQGKVAGLSVVNPSGGDPNAGFEILLRGTNTLTAGQGPLIIIDGVADADIRNINFQEIESFDVLKDGSAAAIYGTRGTNGVIIITTKRARAGTTQIEYDGQLSIQSVARRPEPMTASEFEWMINNFKPGETAYLYGHDTDWFDEITRTPISHKHSLAVSGGSDKFSHRTVANYEQNQGLQIGNSGDKYLFRTNINQKAFDGWLTLDYNAYAGKRIYTPANYDAFRQAFFHNPTEAVYDPSNTANGGYFGQNGMDYYNPVAMIKERDAERSVDDIGLSIRATLNILPVQGLKWDNFFSYNQQHYESRDYRTHYYPSLLGTGGRATIENEYTNDRQWESTLSYTKSFNLHSLQAMAGYTFQEGMYRTSSMTNSNFDTDYFGTDNIGAGSGITDGKATISSGRSMNRYIAFFGRVMYNYDEKYLASVSIRRDGSSRFGKDNKWGWFPAVSVGWRINQEDFLKDVKWVEELKLRAGYGVTGNQSFSSYRSLLRMKTDGYFYYNGSWVNNYSPASNANPLLKWEKKSEWNVGVDFSAFKGRINATVDYYTRTTKDLLYSYKVPRPPYDYDEFFTNVGSIRNSGIEVTVSGTPVMKKDFKWQTTLTFSRNTNKLLKFTNEEFSDTDYKVGWLNTPMGVYAQRLVEGESLGTFYGPVWEGVDENGRDILKGAIGGSVPEAEWEKLGTAYPDFVLGWHNSFNYKNWDLAMMFRASIGGKVFNTYRAEYENLKSAGMKNIMASWLDNTEFTGDPIYSSKYLENATYFKIDNISLGYNFMPKHKYIQRVRVYAAAQNILTITGYKGVDPEVSLSGLAPGIESTSYYPRTTTYTFGVNLTF